MSLENYCQTISIESNAGLTFSTYHNLSGGDFSVSAYYNTKKLRFGIGAIHSLYSGDRLGAKSSLESSDIQGLIYINKLEKNTIPSFDISPKMDNVSDFGYKFSVGYIKTLNEKIQLNVDIVSSRLKRNANYVGANLGEANLSGNIFLDSVYLIVPVRIVTTAWTIGAQAGMHYMLSEKFHLTSQISTSYGRKSWYPALRFGLHVRID